MGLKQQIVNNHTTDIAAKTKIIEAKAFVIYGHTLCMGTGTASFDFEDFVDGSQDKQIDAFTIEELDGHANVYITQATQADGFSSTKLVQLGNGLRWVFLASRSELKKLSNTALRDKIVQFREVQSEIGPSNISIHVNFISNTENEISDEFVHEKERIEAEYGGDVFEHFSIDAVGVSELNDLAKSRDRRIRNVDADLKIRYDSNTGSLINYYSQGLKGSVCTVPATVIAKLVNDNPEGSIFDTNIRQFLGSRGTVNRDIHQTASSSDSYEFWFLNNGITIVCDSYDVSLDPDNPKIMVKNLQVVNGCQTASSLAKAAKDGTLKDDVNVIVRVYQTNDEDLVGKIVLTTNNQNQITSRNLRANDSMQISMEEAFKIKGYFYERKPRQFDKEKDVSRIFTNEEVGQAYLALVLKSPADARSRRYKLWDELNSKVFAGAPIEQYILSALIVRRLSSWLRKSAHYKSKDNNVRTLAKRGLYHIARVASYKLLQGDNWANTTKLKDVILKIENEKLKLDSIFETSFHATKKIFEDSDYVNDVERGIKTSSIDKAIDKYLHIES